MLLSLVSKLPFTIWKPEPTFTVASNLCMWVSKRKKNNNKTLRALVLVGYLLWHYSCSRTPCELRPKLHSCCHNLLSPPLPQNPPTPTPTPYPASFTFFLLSILDKTPKQESLCQDLFLRNPT